MYIQHPGTGAMVLVKSREHSQRLLSEGGRQVDPGALETTAGQPGTQPTALEPGAPAWIRNPHTNALVKVNDPVHVQRLLSEGGILEPAPQQEEEVKHAGAINHVGSDSASSHADSGHGNDAAVSGSRHPRSAGRK